MAGRKRDMFGEDGDGKVIDGRVGIEKKGMLSSLSSLFNGLSPIKVIV